MKKYIKILSFILILILVTSSPLICANEKSFWDYKIVRHAMGGYGGTIYSNHEKALKKSIEKGFKFIEVDMILTNDDKLVMSHGWDKYSCKYNGIKYSKKNKTNMTYKKFIKLKMHGKYNTMDANQFSEYVLNNKDILWELDLRTLNYTQSVKTAKAIIRTFNNDNNVLDKFLVQVGSEEMYKGINEVYNFKHYQYIIHDYELGNSENVIEFCTKKGIESIAVKKDYMNDNLVKLIKDNGLKILCYTIDNTQEARDMLSMGADVICSNFMSENDL